MIKNLIQKSLISIFTFIAIASLILSLNVNAQSGALEVVEQARELKLNQLQIIAFERLSNFYKSLDILFNFRLVDFLQIYLRIDETDKIATAGIHDLWNRNILSIGQGFKSIDSALTHELSHLFLNKTEA